MKKLVLFCSAIFTMATSFAQTARVQVIHNCADRAADSVDVYLGSIKLLDNFAFRTATRFIDAPAGTPITLGVAPKGSTSVADTIYNVTVTLTASAKYILVANGIVSTTGYTPGASVAPFRLSVYAGAHEVADTMGRTDVLVAHGCTDAPIVDVRAGSAVLVNDVAFGNFNSAGYLSLPTMNYNIDVTTADGSTRVNRYAAPLATLGLTDSAITVVASGFLDSTVNSGGKSFGLWVAPRMGGVMIPLPVVSTTSVASVTTNNRFSLAPNPTQNVLNVTATNEGIQSIAIVDLQGRIINEVTGVNAATFNVASLATGTYMVAVTDNTGFRTLEKFVKY